MYVIEKHRSLYYPYDRYHVLSAGITSCSAPCTCIDLKNHFRKTAQAAHAATDTTTTFAVSLKNDGSLYLGDAPTDIQSLITQSSIEQKNNPRFAIVIRADKDVDYGRVIELIDKLKGAGITRFGLATDGAGK